MSKKGALLRSVLLIALCGAAGALSRHAFHATLLVNTLGCFALALLLATADAPALRRHPALRAGLAVGFLGAFTTFSTLCGEIADRFLAGDPLSALGYALLSLSLGVGAVFAGHRAGRWTAHRFGWDA
jgi:fluoride ion exporter CrcB/FEX